MDNSYHLSIPSLVFQTYPIYVTQNTNSMSVGFSNLAVNLPGTIIVYGNV
jgi:hypothetical protein